MVAGALGTVPNSLGKIWEIGNQKKNQDHPDHSIKIGSNNEKSPGDQRRLAVTRALMKDHH